MEWSWEYYLYFHLFCGVFSFAGAVYEEGLVLKEIFLIITAVLCGPLLPILFLLSSLNWDKRIVDSLETRKYKKQQRLGREYNRADPF